MFFDIILHTMRNHVILIITENVEGFKKVQNVAKTVSFVSLFCKSLRYNELP